MTLTELGGLALVYLISIIFIGTLLYKEFLRARFNFNIFFSMLYLLTFYFGFPLTCALVFQFDVAVVKADYLLYAQLAATSFMRFIMSLIKHGCLGNRMHHDVRCLA